MIEFFDYTEDFDLCIGKYLFNLKFVCDDGGG